MTDFYYLVALPFSKLHRLTVEDYESVGTVRRILLEKNSKVEMDTANASYTATLHGVEIAKDDATFCPLDDHRIAFYSRTARTLRHPLPTGWNHVEITARVLTVEGRSPHDVQVADGMIVVKVEAQRPVIVYASEKRIVE